MNEQCNSKVFSTTGGGVKQRSIDCCQVYLLQCAIKNCGLSQEKVNIFGCVKTASAQLQKGAVPAWAWLKVDVGRCSCDFCVFILLYVSLMDLAPPLSVSLDETEL